MTTTFGLLSVVVTVLVFVPYFRSVLRGKTKPHLFTWLLWALMTWTAFVLQVANGAGPGAWSTGLTGLGATVVTILSLRHGEKSITRSDKIALACGLLAFPLWLATRNPDTSAVLVTLLAAFVLLPHLQEVVAEAASGAGACALAELPQTGPVPVRAENRHPLHRPVSRRPDAPELCAGADDFVAKEGNLRSQFVTSRP